MIPPARPVLIHPGDVAGELAQGDVQVFPCGAALLELLQLPRLLPRNPKEPTQLPSARLLQARPRVFKG